MCIDADRFLTRSSSMNIEVSAVNTGKAQAIAYLCEMLGITMHEVMAIGDSLNDVMLLQQAGCSVAMENGVDEVKTQLILLPFPMKRMA